MNKVLIDSLVRNWAKEVGVDLKEIVNNVAALCNQNNIQVEYLPMWAYETSSAEKFRGVKICLEPPLFFDPRCKKETLINRLTYLTGHELLHPTLKADSIGDWFRYDVLGEDYLLNGSPEGRAHSTEMVLNDTIIDSKLFLFNPIFVKGFFDTHMVSCIRDMKSLMLLKGTRKRKSLNLKELNSLVLRVERRAPLAWHIKKQKLASGVYRRFSNDMISQHHLYLRVILNSKARKWLDEAYKYLVSVASERVGNWKKLHGLINKILLAYGE